MADRLALVNSTDLLDLVNATDHVLLAVQPATTVAGTGTVSVGVFGDATVGVSQFGLATVSVKEG